MRALACLVLLLIAAPAVAHKPSDSYLWLSPSADGFVGEWRIALRDLDAAIGVDLNGDRNITWGELRERHAAIAEFALRHLHIGGEDASCTLSAGEQLVDDLSDGAYTVMPLHARCSGVARAVKYSLLFDIDPTHRGLVMLDEDGERQMFVLSPERNEATLPRESALFAPFTRMFRAGVHHIWSGFDHLLFLAALLLSTARATSGLQPLLKDVLWLVTSFTAAHSITLTLAALGVIALPPRFIETAIAVSIVVAGLRLQRPQPRPAVRLAFGFGLIHGFGFANVLFDMQLSQGALASSLFAFNLGVEAGQCTLVALSLPALWYARRFGAYRRVVLPTLAVLIVSMGALWAIERGAGVDVLALLMPQGTATASR